MRGHRAGVRGLGAVTALRAGVSDDVTRVCMWARHEPGVRADILHVYLEWLRAQ